MLGETIDQFTDTELALLGAVINDLEEELPLRKIRSQELVGKVNDTH
jgi:hypothetical protein